LPILAAAFGGPLSDRRSLTVNLRLSDRDCY
jgi:hypothetical protein